MAPKIRPGILGAIGRGAKKCPHFLRMALKKRYSDILTKLYPGGWIKNIYPNLSIFEYSHGNHNI